MRRFAMVVTLLPMLGGAIALAARDKVVGKIDLGGGVVAKVYEDRADVVPSTGRCWPRKRGDRYGRYHFVRVLDSERHGAEILRLLKLQPGKDGYSALYFCSTKRPRKLVEVYSSNRDQFIDFNARGGERLRPRVFRQLRFSPNRRYLAWLDAGCDVENCWTDPYVMDLASRRELRAESFEPTRGGGYVYYGDFKILDLDDCGALSVRFTSGDIPAPVSAVLPKLCR